MKRTARLLFIAACAWAAVLPATATAGPELPFNVGERVTYDVTWMGILGGEGVLEVAARMEYRGHSVFVIKSVGRSVGWVRKLFRVEDHAFSYFDIDRLYSHRMEVKIEEGKYRKLKIIEYDQERNVALYRVNEDEPEKFDMAPGSQDSFSALYALRAKRGTIKVGEPVYFPLFEDRKKYELEVRVVRKERLKLKQGMLDTIVIRPLLKTEGIFQRKGKITIWLSDDENLIPVKMRSKILIGSFIARIRDYRGMTLNFIPYEKPNQAEEKQQ